MTSDMSRLRGLGFTKLGQRKKVEQALLDQFLDTDSSASSLLHATQPTCAPCEEEGRTDQGAGGGDQRSLS